MLRDKIQAIVNNRPTTSDFVTGDPRFIPGTPQYEANLKAIREKYGIQNSAAADPVVVETPEAVQTVETWRVINKKWIYFVAGAVAFWLLWGRR